MPFSPQDKKQITYAVAALAGLAVLALLGFFFFGASTEVEAPDEPPAPVENTLPLATETLYPVPNPDAAQAIDPDDTDIRSTRFAENEEKVALLSRYIPIKSDIELAQYFIEYEDDAYTITAALFLHDADSIAPWIEGLGEADRQSVNLRWWDVVPLVNLNFSPDLATPQFYQHEAQGISAVVYEDINTVLLRVSNQ